MSIKASYTLFQMSLTVKQIQQKFLLCELSDATWFLGGIYAQSDDFCPY